VLWLFIALSPSRTELALDPDADDGGVPAASEAAQVEESHGSEAQASIPGESRFQEDPVVRFLHVSIIAAIFSRRLDRFVDSTAQSLAKAVLQISDGDVGNLAKYALVDAEGQSTGTDSRCENPIYLPEHIGGKQF
jgi:hypothetical protein